MKRKIAVGAFLLFASGPAFGQSQSWQFPGPIPATVSGYPSPLQATTGPLAPGSYSVTAKTSLQNQASYWEPQARCFLVLLDANGNFLSAYPTLDETDVTLDQSGAGANTSSITLSTVYVVVAGGPNNIGLHCTTSQRAQYVSTVITATSLQGAAGPAGATGSAGPIGLTGATGATGSQGPAGLPGAVGAQGPAGPAGPAGAIGAQGPIGLTGATGPAGPIGLTGATGAPGAMGPAGPAGATGPAGPAGVAGSVGAIGPQGPIGLTGATGAAGSPGAAGPAGPAGPTGAIGPQGPAGPIGLTGPTGAAGSAGSQGPIGLTGPAGPQGAAGADGLPGPVGPQGPAGQQTFYGVWAPGNSYAQGSIVVRAACASSQCNQGALGPFMNVTGASNQDPILGDPGYDTANWQLMAPGPINFVPMQVPNAPIVGQINGALAGLNSPAYNNFPFGNNFSCYPIVGAASSSSFEGATCQNFGPGLGTSPSTGKYSTFTITLASPFLAARTVSGSTAADSALTVDLIGGSPVQVLGSCQIGLGGSNCSGNIAAALQAGNALGIALYTYNSLITQNAPGYTTETLPNVTVTVTP